MCYPYGLVVLIEVFDMVPVTVVVLVDDDLVSV